MSQDASQFFHSVFPSERRIGQSFYYQPYFHIRGYLRQKLGQSEKTVPELAQACGYRKLEKFKKHMDAWLKAERPIPDKFLGAIGVEPDMLCKVLVLDFNQWEEAVKKVSLPEYFSARLMPAIWQARSLPENLSPAQAIVFVKHYAKQEDRQCLINYQGLREAWIDPDGSVVNRYRWPEVQYRNRTIYFSRVSRPIGTTGLAGR